MYTFQAGPVSDRYTVTTPWTREGVSLAVSASGISGDVLHGAILMILKGPASLLDCMVVSTNGGEPYTLRTLKTLLDNWTAFDLAEQAWEDRALACDVD